MCLFSPCVHILSDLLFLHHFAQSGESAVFGLLPKPIGFLNFMLGHTTESHIRVDLADLVGDGGVLEIDLLFLDS